MKIKTSAALFAITIGCVYLMFALPALAAKSPEEIEGVSAQEAPVKETPKPHKPLDAFAIAFLGISVGCMFLTSSIHWTMSRRKHLIGEISSLSNFISSNNAVTLSICGLSDPHPMGDPLKKIGEEGDTKLGNLEEEKIAAIRKAARVEAELLRLWG